jgi:phosphopantothenate synthetase
MGIETNLKRLQSQAKALKQKSESLLADIAFNYMEQELIYRVFKSIFSQIKGKEDLNTAKSVLRKTEWTEA